MFCEEVCEYVSDSCCRLHPMGHGETGCEMCREEGQFQFGHDFNHGDSDARIEGTEASWSLQSVGIQSVWGRNAILDCFRLFGPGRQPQKKWLQYVAVDFTWIYWLITNCKPKGFRSGWSIWIPWVQSYQQHVAAEVSKCLIMPHQI